jgi:hypothetical protein
MNVSIRTPPAGNGIRFVAGFLLITARLALLTACLRAELCKQVSLRGLFRRNRILLQPIQRQARRLSSSDDR